MPVGTLGTFASATITPLPQSGDTPRVPTRVLGRPELPRPMQSVVKQSNYPAPIVTDRDQQAIPP